MAYFSPIIAASFVGLSMAAVSVGLPLKLSDPSLPPSLFAVLDDNLPTPYLLVTATRVGQGWRLDFETENWMFSELCGRTTTPVPEGHAHIYAGDNKIGTATLPVFYIDTLPHDEIHLITVSLRGADHRVLVADGKVISAQVVLPPLAS